MPLPSNSLSSFFWLQKRENFNQFLLFSPSPLHQQKVAFTRAASVSPLKAVGLDLSPTMLRSVIGIMDVSSGSLMAFGRYPYRILATLELLTILLLGIYCELILGGVLRFPSRRPSDA